MNNLYLITTAIKQNHVPYSVCNGRFCITSTTELEAAAIALANQPKNTYIFSIEVYLAQKYLHILHKAGSERVNPSIQSQ
jgi:hypothetical protein